MTTAKLDPAVFRRIAAHLTEWPVPLQSIQRQVKKPTLKKKRK